MIRKSETIQIRVEDREKQEIVQNAELHGFENVTAFLLWLYRKYGRKTT